MKPAPITLLQLVWLAKRDVRDADTARTALEKLQMVTGLQEVVWGVAK